MSAPTPAPPPPSSQPPPTGKPGRSTGFKLAIGCAVLALISLLIVAVALIAGASFLGQQVRSWTDAAHDQAAVMTEMAELEESHAFLPPASGEVVPDRAAAFGAATHEAWAAVREETALLQRLSERAERGGDVRRLTAGLEGIGGLARARAAVAESLARHDMPPSEFIWIAHAFHEAPDEGGTSPIADLMEEDEDALAVLIVLTATLAGPQGWIHDLEIER